MVEMTALVLQFWPYILGALGAVFGAWKLRQSGVNAERNRQAQSELAARTEGQKIDDAVAGRSPEDNRGRLGKWSK